MHKKLMDIITKTKQDLTKRKQEVPFTVILNSFQDPPHPNPLPRGKREWERVKKMEKQNSSNKTSRTVRHEGLFAKAIQNPKKGSVAIIAEIKLASPSDQYLGLAQDIQSRAKAYEKAGVDCISVVTEKHFFKGDSSFVRLIKNTISLPVLQKDFIIDPYQVYEAKKAGADAVLLIALIVSQDNLISLVKTAQTIGLEVVVEINSKDDLEKAMATEPAMIAVNARNLDTFEVNVDGACELLKLIPDTIIQLGFSGVTGKAEAEKYKNAGVDGILIGTSLMRADNISEFIERVRV